MILVIKNLRKPASPYLTFKENIHMKILFMIMFGLNIPHTKFPKETFKNVFCGLFC